jgi:Trypsin-like peptidase domain
VTLGSRLRRGPWGARTAPALVACLGLLCAAPHLAAQDFVSLAQRVTPAVAFVLGADADGKPQASGTAFVVGDRLLLTALHVVEEAAQLSVRFPGQASLRADVIAIETERDIGVLRVPEMRMPGPPLLPLASSQSVQLGEPVAVVGYPLPSPEHPTVTMTQGIISAIHNDPMFLQIDAPVNPGNSGGPVLSADGHVLGIVDASLRGAQQFNLAIPIEAAKPLLTAAAQRATPLPLPLTSSTNLALEQSGNDIGPYAHEEKEGASCVPPPPHAALLDDVAVTLTVQKPLHLLAWLSWHEGQPPENPNIFARIDDSVPAQLARPLSHLALQPDTVCLNYIAWNSSAARAGPKFAVKYTLGYRVFNVP